MTPPPGTGKSGWHETQLRGEYDKATGSWDGNFDDMNTLLDGMNAQPMEDASTQFRKASGMIYTSNEEIYSVGYELADAWKGPTAGKAIAQLQALWNTSNNLMGTASMLDSAFGNHAQTLKDATNHDNRPSKGNAWVSAAEYGAGGAAAGTVVEPGGGSIVGGLVGGAYGFFHSGDVDNQHAKDYINNQVTPRTSSDHDQVPANLRVDGASVHPYKENQPNLTHNSSIPTSGAGKIPGGGGAGGAGHIPGGAGHIPGSNGHLPGSDGHLPGSDGNGHIPSPPGGSDLAGLGGGGGGSLAGGLGGGGGGLGGGLGGGGGGLGAGGGLGSTGAGLGGAGTLGAGGAAPRAGVGGANGAGGMPMGGMGGGGGQKEERERTTWLTEDEDVWGGDGDAAPPVIG